MIDPSLPLQAAIVAALKAGIPAARVYDDVPEYPKFPYFSLGPDDVLDDHDQCVGGADTSCQVHVWSRAVGRVEAKQMVAAAILALDQPLTVVGHVVVIHQVTSARVDRDPDGVTQHGVIVVRYATTPAT